MRAWIPVEEIEGVGTTYGKRLRANGIRTLGELRYATVADIDEAARAGRQRAQAWKGQAWLMVTGMSKHAAEVIVSASVASTLWELVDADPDDIVSAVQSAQQDPDSRINKIPDRERIDITRSLAKHWQQIAFVALDFNPSNPRPTTVTAENASVTAAIERAADAALGDIPSVPDEYRLSIRDQLVDVCRDHVLGVLTDEDIMHVLRLLADQPLILADEILKYLGLWPAEAWLRRLALRETTNVTHFTLADPERVRRKLFRGISPARVCAIFAPLLDRELKTQGAEALLAIIDELQHSLSDPGLRALGGYEGGIADLDGTGVQLGLVGHGWDCTHPAFANADLTSDDAPVSDSPWIGLDTAVLSQIVATPLPAQETIARPALGPAGIAPSAQITLFAAESTAAALASAIDRASTALGKGAVLLVPRTCVEVVRGPGVHTMVDLPLPANPEIHAALLRAAEAGLVVIVPAGIGGRNLANLPIDDLLVDPVGSPPAGFFPVIGPIPEPGIADRLAECSSAGVLVVGTSSPWSNRGTGVIRVPDISFTVAGGTERVVSGAGFTAGWHGPHAAAATAAGLTVLAAQATTLHGNVATVESIRDLLQRYTAPSWATVPKRLATRGLRHTAGICAFGVATGETLTSSKLATHDLSAATLLRQLAGLPPESFPIESHGYNPSRRSPTIKPADLPLRIYSNPVPQPQPETEIWSGVMVVGTWRNAFGNGNANGHGYRPPDSAGSLSDAYFTHRGITYTIRGIGTARIGRNSPYSMGLGISPEFQSGDKSRLTFCIGDSKYRLSDSGEGYGHFGSSRTYLWRNNLPSWNPRQQIAVKITFQPTIPDAPVLTAINEENQVTLFWSSPYDGGRTIIRHDYRQKVEDEPFSRWMAIPTSTAGETNANSYTVAGLDNPSECVFEVRAVNIAGTGAVSNRASVTEPVIPVCDRTAQVRDAITAAAGVSDCGDVTLAHLAAIEGPLNLRNQGITALQAGDFSGLSALKRLWLGRNQLNNLPKGVFDGLSALTFLGLRSNQLSQLDAGIFDGLSALTTLFLDRNSVAPLPITISLESAGEGQFKAIALTGAPFEIVLPIRVNGPGTIEGGATSLTIAAGSVESESLRVTRTKGAVSVAIDIDALPEPPPRHRGYALVKSADLPLEVLPTDA